MLNMSVLVFYIGYILFELPSNMILQKVGPANWLAGLTLCWGIVTLCVGFVRSWQALAGLRVLLGIFEAVSSLHSRSFFILTRTGDDSRLDVSHGIMVFAIPIPKEVRSLIRNNLVVGC